MKVKGLFVLIMGALVLSGCSGVANGEQSENAESDLIPEGVENGDISQEFYDEVVRFFEGTQNYDGEQNIYMIEVDPSTGSGQDVLFRRTLHKHAEEYVDFLDTFEFAYENENEKELSDNLNIYIEEEKESTKFMDVTASVGRGSPETYGLLLMMDEETNMKKLDLYDLLDKYKLGYNY